MRPLATGLTMLDEARASAGYTLFAPLEREEALLIDLRGEAVHRWDIGGLPGDYGYLLPGGRLLCGVKTETGPQPAGGKGGHLKELDWDGNLLWEHVDDAHHHDFRRLSNGNTLYIGWERMPPAAAERVRGAEPGNEDEGTIWGDFLKEVTPAGEVAWEWHAHSDLALEDFPLHPMSTRLEFAHCNACEELPDGNIMLSFRRISTILIVELQELAARYPSFIDVHAHIGFALLDQGKTRRALAAYRRGVEIGEAAIPSDYGGVIEWGWLENRPFLRAAHGAVLCHLRLRQWRKALPLMEKMLAWNPGDNQGIRYLIGSAYLRAGRPDDARAFLAAGDNDYPPSRYELALLLLGEQSFEAAATALRLGFVENGYIAEMLCGMFDPLPMTIWHGSNFAEPELAREYVLQYGDLWYKTPGAVAFLRWLHTHPAVMAERAAILECWEALLWEHDIARRGAILDRQQALVNGIDDRLSTEIAVERTDRFGNRVRPWLHSAP